MSCGHFAVLATQVGKALKVGLGCEKDIVKAELSSYNKNLIRSDFNLFKLAKSWPSKNPRTLHLRLSINKGDAQHGQLFEGISAIYLLAFEVYRLYFICRRVHVNCMNQRGEKNIHSRK